MSERDIRKKPDLLNRRSTHAVLSLICLLLIGLITYIGFFSRPDVEVVRSIEYEENFVLANTKVTLEIFGDYEGSVYIIDEIDGKLYEFYGVSTGESVTYDFSTHRQGEYDFEGVFRVEGNEYEIEGEDSLRVIW